MARFRSEKTWFLGQTDVATAREGALNVLSHLGIRARAGAQSTPIEGRAGSVISSLFLWNERTAPYRVRVGVSEASSKVLVEVVFEESSQVGMTGTKRMEMYITLADGLFDALHRSFLRFAALEAA